MSLLLIFGTIILYLIAYHTYGKFLARRIFRIDATAVTPAHSLRDDRDFIPTRKMILFGHHYASIAGTGPIVGPAIAVIWGWLPALLWILFGSILMGAVHDFSALTISVRNQGRSIGDIAGHLISPWIRILFMVLVFVSLLIVLAVFVLVIAALFDLFPQAVLPVWLQIPIAVGLGWLIYRKNAPPFIWSVIALVALFSTVVLGALVPIQLPNFFGIPTTIWWSIALLIYCYIASTLPVWQLLQPRDYINSHQLIIVMGLLILGALVTHPKVVAPTVDLSPAGAPSLFPFLFITIACGAISGFHSLVGSGTSSKQLASENDALLIGYGAMLLEGVLAVLVLVAVSAGIGLHYEFKGVVYSGQDAFLHHYASWGAAEGLGAKVGAFVQGSANMIVGLGIPMNVAIALMGMFVASFAGTTLDTATRIQRYIVLELAEKSRINILKGRHGATSLAVITAAILAFYPMRDPASGILIYGKGGMILWPLFGTANQLLAALVLIIATVYLVQRRTPWFYTAIPALLMIVMTSYALILNLKEFLETEKWHLLIIGLIMCVVEIFIIIESGKIIFKSAHLREIKA